MAPERLATAGAGALLWADDEVVAALVAAG